MVGCYPCPERVIHALFWDVEDADVSTQIQNNIIFQVLLFPICYKVSFKNNLMNVVMEKLEPLHKGSHPGMSYLQLGSGLYKIVVVVK